MENIYFEIEKQQNLKSIRNLLWKNSSMKISDIAEKMELSYPTVSRLLKELIQQGIVVQDQELITCGGRPGARYRINQDYKQAVVMYFEEKKLNCFVYDYRLMEVFDNSYEVDHSIEVDDIVEIVYKLLEDYTYISDVVMGVPGAVLDKEIVCLPVYPNLVGNKIAEKCSKELGVNFYVENDTNAIALSLMREKESFAHIAYINHCIGVGIIYKGEVIQGVRGYAGELEYICTDLRDMKRSLVECIVSLVCVLDLPLIYISKEECREITVIEINDILSKMLPVQRIPEIKLIEDSTNKYKEGLMRRIVEEWKQEF